MQSLICEEADGYIQKQHKDWYVNTNTTTVFVEAHDSCCKLQHADCTIWLKILGGSQIPKCCIQKGVTNRYLTTRPYILVKENHLLYHDARTYSTSRKPITSDIGSRAMKVDSITLAGHDIRIKKLTPLTRYVAAKYHTA